MKAIPITKKVGKTVPAVRIGCHAGSFCCLNALSATNVDMLIIFNISVLTKYSQVKIGIIR